MPFIIPSFCITPLASVVPQTQRNITTADAKRLVQKASTSLEQAFRRIDLQTQNHLRNVLCSMRTHKLAAHHFVSQDGYGHADFGRDTLDEIYATMFQCEAAIVRIQFHSGTHAIASVLFGALRHGDELLSLAGPVYDTLEEVIGLRSNIQDVGSLRDMGITYRELPLLSNGNVDFESIPKAMSSATRMVFIQRSFGYAWRKVLSIMDIQRMVQLVKHTRPDVICFVDNCYGEFVEHVEPVHASVGADVMAGSLIKNLGGGIVPSGAYVAGRTEWVEKARCRLAAPGVGGGATLGYQRAMCQGLFMAPQTVGEALKGSLLVGEVMTRLGYAVNPARNEHGFVRAVEMGCEDKLVKFCGVVQRNGPVGAFFQPTKGATDGYADDVVFAQATFVDGSTSELSADGPVREPFVVFAQGGLFWGHWAIALEEIVQAVGWKE